jgi:hypothetical protein
MREAMDLISWIGMAQSIQRCGHMRSECKLAFETMRMPAIEPGSQAWEGCGCRETTCALPVLSVSFHMARQLSK